jgi:hypothetical protein
VSINTAFPKYLKSRDRRGCVGMAEVADNYPLRKFSLSE